jgi:hypothetical protein
MSAKAVSEYTGKELLYRELNVNGLVKLEAIQLSEETNFDDAIANSQWVKSEGVGFPFFNLILLNLCQNLERRR